MMNAPDRTAAPFVHIDGLSVSYGKKRAIHDVSGQFGKGSLTAIAGPNGAGKSTLLKCIAGIIRPQQGSVRFDPAFRGRIAYLPQASSMQRDFPMTVAGAVTTGLWPQLGDWRALTADMKMDVTAALDAVGLSALANAQIGSLSGGQFQRMLFARLIVQRADLILLDEPFAAIDAETTQRLIQLLLSWHAEGRTIICVLHDLLLIHKYFPESFVLAGHCLGRGHTHQLFEQKLLSFDLDMAEIKTPDESGAPDAPPCSCPCCHSHD